MDATMSTSTPTSIHAHIHARYPRFHEDVQAQQLRTL